jgi:hypothetical protein
MASKKKKTAKKPIKKSKKKAVFLTVGTLGFLGGIGCGVAYFLMPGESGFNAVFPEIPTKKADTEAIYSNLTGLPLASAEQVTAPAYCIQTPNGMDGARPQAGLNQAGVVFEAIAEAGITRFAAIYQDPTSAIIGPIRSLRMYYLKWDTPFDCTIVHAGGAPDAIKAVSSGGYKDLTESYQYMYRGTNKARRWNNLFTTSTLLAKMNADRGYGGSNIKGFTRMTPDESLKFRVDNLVTEKLVIYEASTGKTSEITPKATAINVDFGRLPNFNVHYDYDAASNTYLRSFASGAKHEVYQCPDGDLGEKNPEDNCTLAQLAPSVVAVMIVQEKRASDSYHEDITTTGGGEACVFQNGLALKGTWSKASDTEQIKFYDANGSEIALAPGQTVVEAIPGYGGLSY